jgi:hypothetical protein
MTGLQEPDQLGPAMRSGGQVPTRSTPGPLALMAALSAAASLSSADETTA